MDYSLGSRFKSAWNAFRNREPTAVYNDIGPSYSRRPDRPRFARGIERTFIMSIYNRIALDVAQIDILHCKLDEDGRYIETITSDLNTCLTLEANIDQTSRAFIQDVCMSLFDEGVVAIIPVDTTRNPRVTDSYDIQSMRTGKITDWYPAHVKVEVYNERTARKQEIIMPKSDVCIIENPFYAVMNHPNSTLKRLIRKLDLLDAIDEQSGSGKLDMIIQLPYTIKTETRRAEAEKRRADVEKQLSGSKYGIAYVDGTERVTQLNRPIENNLMKQIEYLTAQAYSQLNMDQTVLDGTADEKTMLNYNNRTVEPVISAIVDEMKRKFLSKTARTQKQSIKFFRDPFKLVPVSQLAEIADKFGRNEIMTSNEFRQVIGMKPAKDPGADELRNKNLAPAKQEAVGGMTEVPFEEGEFQNGEI
ncbi:MAG: phage portal protein [Firmicutes bacterium]|nr:phage portal protein [Bacillota bacterium]